MADNDGKKIDLNTFDASKWLAEAEGALDATINWVRDKLPFVASKEEECQINPAAAFDQGLRTLDSAARNGAGNYDPDVAEYVKEGVVSETPIMHGLTRPGCIGKGSAEGQGPGGR